MFWNALQSHFHMPLIPELGRCRQVEFKGCLIYRMISRQPGLYRETLNNKDCVAMKIPFLCVHSFTHLSPTRDLPLTAPAHQDATVLPIPSLSGSLSSSRKESKNICIYSKTHSRIVVIFRSWLFKKPESHINFLGLSETDKGEWSDQVSVPRQKGSKTLALFQVEPAIYQPINDQTEASF